LGVFHFNIHHADLMKLYVHKHPDAKTLAECKEVQDDAPEPQPPLVLMTVAQFESWRQGEIDSGWTRPQPVAPVPQSVSPWQMRRALNQLGLRAMVEAAVAAGDQDARDGWDYALEIRRDNPLLAGMASALGMTNAQLDDLFRLAASFQ